MTISKYNGNWTGYLEYTVTTVEQSEVANTSKIKVDVWVGMSGGSIQFNTTANVTVSVSGQRKILPVGNLNLNYNKKYLGSVDFILQHDSRGVGEWTINLSSNMSSVVYSNLSWGSVNVNYKYSAKKINRLSTVEVTSNVLIGGYMTINILSTNVNNRHNIRYEFNGLSGEVASDVSTEYRWTVPKELKNVLSTSLSGSGVIYVDTYYNDNLIGTTQDVFTATIPEQSSLPVLDSITLTDANTSIGSIVPESDYFVKILSNIKVHFNYSEHQNGSTITGVFAEIDGKNQSTSDQDGLLGIMTYDGSIKIKAKIQDSRGLWSDEITKTVTIVDYHTPVLSISVVRSGSSLDTLTVKRTAKIAPIMVNGQNRNTGLIYFRVSPANIENYGAEINKFSFTNNLVDSPSNLTGTYTITRSWKVKAFLTDRVITSPITAVDVAATEKATYYYDEQGMSFGKIRERYSLENEGDFGIYNGIIYTDHKPIQHYQLSNNDGSLLSLGGTDLNTITKTGMYYVPQNTYNSPSQSHGYLTVLAHNNQNVSQQFIVMNDEPNIYYREKVDGLWVTNWTSMVKEQSSIVKTIILPYNVQARLLRRGNMVYLNVERQRKTMSVSARENMFATETIPSGFRPESHHTLTLFLNVSTTLKNPVHYHLNTDGRISVTGNNSGDAIVYGNVSYYTNDPYP